MNLPVHPSTERISDLLAVVLPAAEAMELNAHLASCAACQQVRDDVIGVVGTLADEGAAPLEMPVDVAASLDAALRRASAERAAGVTMLAPEHRPHGRQPWKWLAGAAAAVAVVSLGVAGLQALPRSGSDSASVAPAGLSPHGRAVNRGTHPPEYASPTQVDGGGFASDDVDSLSPEQVPARARRLATAAPGSTAIPDKLGCAVPITGGPSTVIRFEGKRAVLTVDRDIRVVTVYDCATATQTLFVSGY